MSFGYGEHIGVVNIRGEWIEVAGLRIRCLMAGQTGSSVLLLHGGGYDSAFRSYKQSMGPLSQYHKVFAPDWPGYGESDKPKMRYTTDYYVDFLGHLMDALGLEKASLVGTSMGGAISLGFSLRSPERVEKLVLVDSHGLGKEVPGRVVSYAMVRLPLLSKLVWAAMGRSRRMIRWSLQSVFHDPQAVTRSIVEEDFQAAKKPGEGQAWRYWLGSEIGLGGFRTNFVEQLHTLAVPTLILHGEEDRYVPVSWARRAHVDRGLRVVRPSAVWALAHTRKTDGIQPCSARVFGKRVKVRGIQASLAFKPASHPLPSDQPSSVDVVDFPAPAAYRRLLLQGTEGMTQHRGYENTYSHKDQIYQYRHETLSVPALVQ